MARFDRNEFADQFKKEQRYLIIQQNGRRVDQLYFYNGKGTYNYVCEQSFKGIIKRLIPRDEYKPKLVNDIYMDLMTEDPDDPHLVEVDSLNSNPKYINFQNGLLDLETWKIVPFSPDIIYTRQIPCSYDPDEEPEYPEVLKDFLNHCFSGDSEQIDLLYEYMGLLISNIDATVTKNALFITGRGNTGKSVLRNLLEDLVGSENCDASDIEEYNERFGTSQLYLKRLGGCADMKTGIVINPNVFKKITGSDKIRIEFKGENAFSYKYTGMLVFCANELPMIEADVGSHVFDRMCIMKATGVVYDENYPEFEGIVRRDPLLRQKLKDESVRKYLVHQAIKGLKRLMENNFTFHITQKNIDYMDEYKRRMFSVDYFIKDCCVTHEDYRDLDRFRTSDIYNAYEIWCASEKPRITPHSKEQFFKSLTELGISGKNKIHGIDCFTSFTLNETFRNKTHLSPATKPMDFTKGRLSL